MRIWRGDGRQQGEGAGAGRGVGGYIGMGQREGLRQQGLRSSRGPGGRRAWMPRQKRELRV
eukprot:442717-Pleurochrysis_carterae.AAC.1